MVGLAIALLAAGVRIRGPLVLRRAQCHGEVRLQRAHLEAGLRADEMEVTGDEAAWLIAQIERDGELTDNERCLLEHLKSARAKLHPSLKALLDKVHQQVTTGVSLSDALGVPLSVTTTSNVKLFGPSASAGVQLNTPDTGSIEAPAGTLPPATPAQPEWFRPYRSKRRASSETH